MQIHPDHRTPVIHPAHHGLQSLGRRHWVCQPQRRPHPTEAGGPTPTWHQRMLVSPEPADILSAIIRRLRQPGSSIPLVASYDVHERVWNPPMPLLFQREIGTEHRAFTPSALRKLLLNTLAATGLTDAAGEPLTFSPHDFRRIFVTDAILGGLPPHVAQVICGHKSIDTTMGYKAIYPAETIEAHRAFIARRRAARPGEEYRTPTEEERDAFLAHRQRKQLTRHGSAGRWADTTRCISILPT